MSLTTTQRGNERHMDGSGERDAASECAVDDVVGAHKGSQSEYNDQKKLATAQNFYGAYSSV